MAGELKNAAADNRKSQDLTELETNTDNIIGNSKLLAQMRDLIWRKHYSMARFILHQADLTDGLGEVYLPYALERKYPNAAKEWGWQYIFAPKNFHSIHARAKPVVTI